MTNSLGSQCPCGSGMAYRACCEPLHHGQRQAETAEELMRSRYSAYACRDADYLFRTWHPRTRPPDLLLDPGIRWTGLDIVTANAGGAQDDRGEVEFLAHFDTDRGRDTLHEHSRFERRAGRWFYIDGDY
jgi:SEC-C motif domain protein